ncbi:MAG: electron transfer flavoprotein subunit beta/FixA family protein, partial [Phycisphaerales bacterium]|nr:electron transfer flavoprotein subunit beta/FixA family protein [Phycisphaerales bacterium]
KNISGDAMKADGTVNRAAQPAIFNPEDLSALEEALAVRDAHGGTVTVITMGLPKACDILREALYRGADRVILITDRRAAGSDSLATSYILAQAIRPLSPDLVFCGRQAIDGDTAQVGPQLAEKLGCTLITYLEEPVALDGRTVTARRNVSTGYEVVACELPALVTVMETANTVRPPNVRLIMRFKNSRARAELARTVTGSVDELDARCEELKQRGLLIDQWDLDDLSVDFTWCGLEGSPTKVHRIQSLILAGGDYKEFPPTEQGIGDLIGELVEEHTIA